MPTVLEACGCEVPAHVQGRSLAPILAGEREQLTENWGVIETAGGEIGIRTPTHLLGLRLEQGEVGAAGNPSHFYDLRDDPYEMNNLAGTGEQVQTAAELEAVLRAWQAETPWLSPISQD